MTEPQLDYLLAALGDRSEVEWFTDAATRGRTVAGMVDVYLRTPEGEVTWGWSVEPVPLDPGGRRFRRFRHPDGWFLLTDAEEPELLALPSDTELHSVSDGRQVLAAVELPAGSAPDLGDAIALARAAGGDTGADYRIDPAWPADRISQALSVWATAHLGRELEFAWREAGPAELAGIDALRQDGGEEAEPEELVAPLGLDEEIAELIGDFQTIAWFQADLSWPDEDDREAFRDRVDVRARLEQAGLSWLAAVEAPAGDEDLVWARGERGSLVGLDPDEPTRLVLPHDRLVLAVSRPVDGFEPAGLSVELGRAPSSEQWEELRSALGRHEGTVLVHAPGWSEDLVSEALSVWAWAWGGAEVEFGYDFDDPIPQAAFEANDALEDQPPVQPTPGRVRRTIHCTFQEPGSLPFEDPFPCGRPATHRYTPPGSSEQVLVVCQEHLPPDARATTLMQR